MSQVELYRRLHTERPGYGRSSESELAYMEALFGSAPPASLLDYGAGKSNVAERLGRRLGARRVVAYDPAIAGRDRPPEGPFDAAICTEVLEHVPEAEVDAFLSALAALSDRVYLHIAVIPAQTMLPDGANAHCTVRPAPWWLERIARRFPTVVELPPRRMEAARFATWTLDDRSRARLARWVRRAERRRSWRRRRALLLNRLRLALGAGETRAQVLAALEGRRVALVGNGEALAQTRHGERIEGADLVIRFNRAPLISFASHGRRTDWLVTASPEVKQGLARRRGVSRVIWTGDKLKRLSPSLLRGDPPIYVVERAIQDRLGKTVDARPSSGFQAIDLLRESRVSRVELFGFDFGASGSLSGWRAARPRETHDFAAEGRRVRELLETDGRFALIE
jgi:hypothetical protein